MYNGPVVNTLALQHEGSGSNPSWDHSLGSLCDLPVLGFPPASSHSLDKCFIGHLMTNLSLSVNVAQQEMG